MTNTDGYLETLSALASADPFAVAAGTGAVITGGIYAAFPIMVMPALDRLGLVRATKVMRAINVAAERPPFLVLFFGTAAASAAAGTAALTVGAHDEGAGSVLLGASLAVAAFALTVLVNVPLNRRLATTNDPAGAWAPYRRCWGAANGVRAVMSIAGGVLLLTAH